MKVLAFAASNSKHSINRKFVSYAANLLQSEIMTEADIEILDLNDFTLPVFSVDLEKVVGEAKPAREFHEKIASADALLISYAEHNGHYSAFYKNLFDWTSRITKEVYCDKPAVFFSVSPGPGGAKSVLEAAKASASFFGADLKASLSIPSFNDNFDLENNRFSNKELQNELVAVLNTLKN